MQQNNRWNGRKIRLMLLVCQCALLSLAFHFCTFLEYDGNKIQIAEHSEVRPGVFEVPFQLKELEQNHPQLITIEAGGSAQTSVDVQLNSRSLKRILITSPELKEYKVRFQEAALEPGSNLLQLSGSSPQWKLDHIEIGNYLGSSKGILEYFVLDRGTTPDRAPSLLHSAFVFFCFLMIGLLQFASDVRGRRALLYSGLAILSMVLLALLLLAPLVSSYLVVLAPHSILLIGSLMFIPSLEIIFIRICDRLKRVFPEPHFVESVLVVAAIFIFFLSAMLYSLRLYGDYSGFLQLSEKRTPEVPSLFGRPDLLKTLKIYKSGYDGQYMYFIVFDPFMQKFKGQEEQYKQYVDNPAYRYGRIGYPLLAKLFSADRPEIYPKTMILLILASFLIAGSYLVKILLYYGKRPLWALLYVLVPGLIVSLNMGLPEPIAGALLLAGIYFYLKETDWAAVLFFAVSLLFRETGAILLIAILLTEVFAKKNFRRSLVYGISFLPCILWRVFVAYRFMGTLALSDSLGSRSNVTIPFRGILDVWSALRAGTYAPEFIHGAYVFPFLILLLFLVAISFAAFKRNFITLGLLLYTFLAISLNYTKVWAHVVNTERTTYEAFICSILVIPFLKDFPVVLRYMLMLFFVFMAFYDLFANSAAPTFRAGFLGCLYLK